jgi:hypothetical protein
MPGILFDIRDDYGFHFRSGCSAHPLTERNVEAAEASLIRSDSEELPGNNDTIETSPQMAECVMHQSCHCSHRCDIVVDALENSVAVSLQLGVRASFRDASQIRNCLGHYALPRRRKLWLKRS